ncbi:MAG: hypothetical protein LW817_04150 [Candidatus Caenarcaniphilales bacterium]|nr:hypothetical protein [Candidatus Caenarcaniphilales bacterium]
MLEFAINIDRRDNDIIIPHVTLDRPVEIMATEVELGSDQKRVKLKALNMPVGATIETGSPIVVKHFRGDEKLKTQIGGFMELFETFSQTEGHKEIEFCLGLDQAFRLQLPAKPLKQINGETKLVTPAPIYLTPKKIQLTKTYVGINADPAQAIHRRSVYESLLNQE